MFGSDWENVMFRNQGGPRKIQNTFINGDLVADTNFSGLIPRTIFSLFKEIQKDENKSQSFVVYCSFLQIYNEKIFDLLTVINVWLIALTFYRTRMPQIRWTLERIKWTESTSVCYLLSYICAN